MPLHDSDMALRIAIAWPAAGANVGEVFRRLGALTQ